MEKHTPRLTDLRELRSVCTCMLQEANTADADHVDDAIREIEHLRAEVQQLKALTEEFTCESCGVVLRSPKGDNRCRKCGIVICFVCAEFWGHWEDGKHKTGDPFDAVRALRALNAELLKVLELMLAWHDEVVRQTPVPSPFGIDAARAAIQRQDSETTGETR